MYAAGIDVGTTGVKCTIFNDKSEVVSGSYLEYETVSPAPDCYEINPSEIFARTCDVISDAVKKAEISRIDAMCFTSFGESFVCLDDNDKPLSSFMLYIDKRGADCCEELLSKMSEADFFAVSGQFVEPMFSCFKMRSLFRSMPEVKANTKTICFVADFVAYMLGAEHKCDYSLASRSGMLDVRKLDWWDFGVDFSLVPREALPELVKSGSPVGTMSAEMSARLGIEEGTKLILCGQDQIAAAVGSGAWSFGDIANGMGTVDCMTMLVDGEIDKKIMLDNRLCMVPYIREGLFATYAVNYTGGSILKWFRDNLARELSGRADSYAVLDKEAYPTPTDITVVPSFAKSDIPAAIYGIKLSTTREELYRAFLEGETFEMKQYLDALVTAGADASKIITVGGGAKSPLWMQIRSDILGKPILIPENTEAGTLCSAMLCFMSLGIYENIPQAQKENIRYKREYTPNDKVDYSASYSRYLKTLNSLKDIYND